jgi:cystathionine beta-lyase/cystathionine gamma-synthase
MSKKSRSIDTKVIHSGEQRPRVDGALVQPIFQTATYEYEYGLEYHDVKYIRLNNSPNHVALGKKLAAIESGETAMVVASGMAAITTTLLSFLSSGDHMLCHKSVYGGTNGLISHDFPDLNIAATYVDACNPADWEKQLRPETKLFYLEAITNPTMEIADFEAVVAFAKEHGLITVIDNTFASPFNFRPAEHGFDISLHSATKYINGHSDIAAGVIITRKALMEKIVPRLNHFGGCLDANSCFLLNRGVKTLSLRMRQHNASALTLAKFLEDHPKVKSVNYPGLASHPYHERAKKLFDGNGGMISFEPDGDQQFARKLLASLKLVCDAPSLGGVETLACIAALVTHSGVSAEERQRAGISDSLIRLSVGIEDVDDLIEDFKQALEA